VLWNLRLVPVAVAGLPFIMRCLCRSIINTSGISMALFFAVIPWNNILTGNTSGQETAHEYRPLVGRQETAQKEGFLVGRQENKASSPRVHS